MSFKYLVGPRDAIEVWRGSSYSTVDELMNQRSESKIENRKSKIEVENRNRNGN